jgi:hypothetical protein
VGGAGRQSGSGRLAVWQHRSGTPVGPRRIVQDTASSVVEGTSKGPLRRRRSFSRLAASHLNAMRPSASDSVPLLAASEVPMRTFVPPWFTARWSQVREMDLYSFPMELLIVQVARLET